MKALLAILMMGCMATGQSEPKTLEDWKRRADERREKQEVLKRAGMKILATLLDEIDDERDLLNKGVLTGLKEREDQLRRFQEAEKKIRAVHREMERLLRADVLDIEKRVSGRSDLENLKLMLKAEKKIRAVHRGVENMTREMVREMEESLREYRRRQKKGSKDSS